MWTPSACHMQDKGKTHTFSSHDSAEVRTPAPIITACFIVCQSAWSCKCFVCLYWQHNAKQVTFNWATTQRQDSSSEKDVLNNRLAIDIQYIHEIQKTKRYKMKHEFSACLNNAPFSNKPYTLALPKVCFLTGIRKCPPKPHCTFRFVPVTKLN